MIDRLLGPNLGLVMTDGDDVLQLTLEAGRANYLNDHLTNLFLILSFNYPRPRLYLFRQFLE